MRSFLRHIIALAMSSAALLALTGSAEALPAPCAPERPDWIAVRFDGKGWTTTRRETLLSDLRTGSVAETYALCAVVIAPTDATAWLTFDGDFSQRVRVFIEILGAEHRDRAERVVELGALPDDARTLSLSLAADELLAVKYDALERARTFEATERVERPEPPEDDPPRRFHVLASTHAQRFATQLTLLGARAELVFEPRDPARRLHFSLGGEWARSLLERADVGDITARAIGAQARLHLRLAGARGRTRLAADVFAQPLWLSLEGAGRDANTLVLGQLSSLGLSAP